MQKICYSAVEEKKIVQCLIVPEIDWIFRDVNFRNMKSIMLIEYFKSVHLDLSVAFDVFLMKQIDS